MADSNRVALRITREQSFNVVVPVVTAENVTGTNTLYNIRFNKEAIEAEKETLVSDEIRSDRMVQDLVQVGYKSTGTFESELSAYDHDDLMAAALQSDYAIAVTTACTISGQTITADAGAPFGPLIGAKFIKLANCATAGNNGVKVVVSVTTTVITLGTGSLTGSDSADTIDFLLNYVSAIDAVTVTVAGQTLTATAGTFSSATQGARYVKLASMATAGNNGIKKVVSCTSTVLTLAAGSLSGSDAGDVCTVQCCYIRTGGTYITHMIQKEFTDISRYILFTGQGVNQMDLKMDAKNKAMLTFAFMGYQGYSRTNPVNTLAAIASTSNPIINTSTNVGGVTKDGTAMLNPVKSISLSVKNGLRDRPQIGASGTAEHGVGRSEVTGQIDVYFKDKELLNAFLSHTAMSMEFPMTDSNGNVTNIFIPRLQSSKATTDASGINTDVMQVLPFQAIRDPSLGYQLQIDRLLA